MIFCEVEHKKKNQISIGIILIDKVTETKIVGYIIDDQLNLQSHIKPSCPVRSERQTTGLTLTPDVHWSL